MNNKKRPFYFRTEKYLGDFIALFTLIYQTHLIFFGLSFSSNSFILFLDFLHFDHLSVLLGINYSSDEIHRVSRCSYALVCHQPDSRDL